MKENTQNILVVVTVALAIFVTNLDISIVNIALPTLSNTFNTGTDEVSRVIIAYLLALVGSLLVFGRLADQKGVEKIFIIGFSIFTIASVFCALSPTIDFLNIFRFMQGLGGAMLLAGFGAIVLKYLPPEKRGRAFGFSTVFGGIGVAIGPPVGGFLIEYLSWHWIFIVNVPIGIIGISLALRVLNKKHVPPPSSGSSGFDLTGAVLSFVGLFVLFYMMNTADKSGWLSLRTLGMLAFSILCFILFIIREKRYSTPLVDLSVFKIKNLVLGFFTLIFVTRVLDGLTFIFPFFFDLICKIGAGQTGLLLMIAPLAIIFVSPVSGYLSDFKGPRFVGVISLIFLVGSTVMIVMFNSQTSYYFIAISFILFGIALALFYTSNTTFIMNYAEKGKEGMLSALLAVVTYLGASFGISVFEIVFSLKFDINKSDSLASIPENIVLSGYQNAMILGIILSVLGLIAIVIAKEKGASK